MSLSTEHGSFIITFSMEFSARQYCVKDSRAHFTRRKTDDGETQSARVFHRQAPQYLKEEKKGNLGRC